LPDPESPVPDDNLGSRLGRALEPAYEIEGELGRGGMAIVYRARDARLKRSVAIKLLPPELAFRGDVRSRFLREAETAARLNHPNIVPIYTVDERDGLVYFVMALVRGGSIGDRLKTGNMFSPDETRRIMREVADALAYAHRAGVVHRDIKPDNVLLDADSGRAMVTDFGIARAASEDTDASRLTATGAVIGTPAYMSPEQCAGDVDIDGRSDLYSLGTVAYQMLTGQPPFIGGNAPSIMMKHVTERPLSVRTRQPSVPRDLETIVMRLLEKDSARRFSSGQDLVAVLDGAAVAPLAPESQPESTLPKYVMDVSGIGGHGVAGLHTPEPATLTRKELREMRRAQRRARTLPDRVRKYRGNLFSYGGTIAMIFGVNFFTNGGHYWWAVFPAMGLSLAAVLEGVSLMSEEGVPLSSLLSGKLPPHMLPGYRQPAAIESAANEDVLAGPHGAVLRQARTDHQRIQELIAKLSDAERRMLPDVKQTADGLFDRVESLARALHQLEWKSDIGATRLSELDARIADIERNAADSGERERRLGLLRRQREMLVELEGSHARLLEQYESAGLLLQNLALDLLKVRSSGLDAALLGINSATQEARALSKEIGYVLSAAEELRRLEPT
jgi:Protein kinase domain